MMTYTWFEFVNFLTNVTDVSKANSVDPHAMMKWKDHIALRSGSDHFG